MCNNFFLPSLHGLAPGFDKNICKTWSTQRFEGDEDDLDFGGLWLFSPDIGDICAATLTVARLMYSTNSGLPDCSRLSRTNVNGEAPSRPFRSREINSRLCVLRCWREEGGML